MNLDQLEQFRYLKNEINMLENRIIDLRNRNESFVSDTVTGSSKDRPFQQHTIIITGYGNPNMEKISELEIKYIKRQEQLCEELQKIENFIDRLQNSELRQIIELRYVKGFSWNAVARNVYGYPSGDTARMAVKRFFAK